MIEDDLKILFKIISYELWALTYADENIVDSDYAMKIMENIFADLQQVSPEAKLLLGDVLQEKIDATETYSEFYKKMKMSL
jgi:hypothetical protein